MLIIYGKTLIAKTEITTQKKNIISKESKETISQMNLGDLMKNSDLDIFKVAKQYATKEEQEILEQIISNLYNIERIDYDKIYNIHLSCFIIRLVELLNEEFDKELNTNYQWLNQIQSDNILNTAKQKKILNIYNRITLQNNEQKYTPFDQLDDYETYFRYVTEEICHIPTYDKLYKKYDFFGSFLWKVYDRFSGEKKIFDEIYNNNNNNAISNYWNQINNTLEIEKKQRIKENTKILTQELKKDLEQIDLSLIFTEIQDNIENIKEWIIEYDDIKELKLIKQLEYNIQQINSKTYDKNDNVNIVLLIAKLQQIGIQHLKHNKDIDLTSDVEKKYFTGLLNCSFHDTTTVNNVLWQSSQLFEKYNNINKSYDFLGDICLKIWFPIMEIDKNEQVQNICCDVYQYGLQNVDKIKTYDLLQQISSKTEQTSIISSKTEQTSINTNNNTTQHTTGKHAEFQSIDPFDIYLIVCGALICFVLFTVILIYNGKTQTNSTAEEKNIPKTLIAF